MKFNAYERQHGCIKCIPHSLSFTLLIMSLEVFCVQNSQVSLLKLELASIKIEWHYSYHILGHVRSHNERHACVLNNWGMLIQRSICPWVNEDRFKRKWILTDIKQSTIKAAQYNGMMVFFILRRVSVKGKRTGIKMLKQFLTPSKCVSIIIFLNMSRYSTATCHVQGCVHDKIAKCWLKGMMFHIEIFLNVHKKMSLRREI